MAIRWDEFPHGELRLKIYARLAHNALDRSAEDSLRHILRRQLASRDTEVHRRFVELEARYLVEHLRCTRDVYREFVASKKCHPVLEAHWVVLRCAVFPTALAVLRQKLIEYAKLTSIPGRDLTLLFGIHTGSCRRNSDQTFDGQIALLQPPDLEDETPATDEELESLGKLVDEDGVLVFKDILDGGSIFRPNGGGPFSTDDCRTILHSFEMSGLHASGISIPEWVAIRERWWNLHMPWTEGLSSLFISVQEELISQWRALPPDSLVHELKLGEGSSGFRSIVVPARKTTHADEAAQGAPSTSSSTERRKPGRKPRLPREFVFCAGSLWRKAIFNADNSVPDDRLREIAVSLDKGGHLPPAAYLEGKAAQEIKSLNSRNSNSKVGPIKTWLDLVSRGDKDHLRGMRRLLSRCAKKADVRHLSGN